jgi:Flp pilus assembly protein TadB
MDMPLRKLKMTTAEWRDYVRMQMDRPKDKATYIRIQLTRAVPLSLMLGIIFSGITIYFWGFKEYSRMMMQLLLGLTLATAVLGPMIKRMEQKFKDE